MLPTTIRSPPAAADYMPLAEYQSQTPESFTDGKPILHYHLAGAKATIPRSQCGSLAIFPQDTAAAANNANDGEAAEELAEQTVDVFATSECVLESILVHLASINLLPETLSSSATKPKLVYRSHTL